MLAKIGHLSPGQQRLILVLGCLVLYCLWLVRVPLIEPDETRYTEATREMITTGNYLVPHFNFVPRYQKPIFYYWVQAAARLTLGSSEAALRFPSALCAMVLVLLLHAFLLRWLDAPALGEGARRTALARGGAFLGAAAFATMPLIAVWTRAAVTDLTLTLFMTGALLAILQATLVQNGRWWYLLAAACCGLAFLTKGPVGVIIPCLVWLLFHWRQRTLRQEWRRVPWLPSIAIFLLIALPWYVGAYFFAPGFLQQFFITENLERFNGASIDQRMTLAQYLLSSVLYLLMSVAILFPFSAFIAGDAVLPFAGNPAFNREARFGRMRQFAWIWLGTVIVFFLLSKIQFLNYIQSASGAAAILFTLSALGRITRSGGAAPVPRETRQRWAVGIRQTILGLIGVALIGLLVWTLACGGPRLRAWAAPFPPMAAMVMLGLVLVTGGVLLVVIGRQERLREPIPWLLAAWTAFFAVILIGIIPYYFQRTFAPVATVGQYLRLLPREQVVTLLRKSPEDIIYYGNMERKVEMLSPNESSMPGKLTALLAQNAAVHLLIVTDMPEVARLKALGQVAVLKQFPYFVLVQLSRK
jgi:4-amino-4-deoxy-L-arabinose transferase-like glycosyltransferase